MIDDLPFLPGEDRPSVPQPRKCRRHEWVLDLPSGEDGMCPNCVTPWKCNGPHGAVRCYRCGKARDAERSRRGRTSRNRGNAIEREVGKKLGLRRVGQYGGPDDLSGELFAAQVKSGGAFPERLWSWLKAVPANAGQTPILVVTDAPGPGHRRRAVVVLDLDEWVALHGPTGDAA